MADISRIEPTQLPNGLWLDGNEYARENVEESSGVLSLETGETEGYRVGPELDVGAISKVKSSKLEWVSTGDVEVLAAVSEVSAQGSLEFDGEDDYVETSLLYDMTQPMTLGIWAKVVDGSEVGDYIGFESDDAALSYAGTYIQRRDGYTRFRIRAGSILDVADNELNAQDWNFYCLTYPGGSNNGNAYINGINVSTINPGYRLGIDKPLLFGWVLREFTNTPSRGSLSSALFYSSSLSDQQVLDIYNTTGNVLANVSGHWPLDDTNSTARDISGNNNDGTIIGASHSPDNPLLQQATNGQAIPGVTPGDNLTSKKLYTQQRFNRDTTGDPSPTLTELKATVEGTGGALPLINGGLIRSAHTQNNTMIR